MARYAVGIEYSGAGYSGWQRQKHSLSVQQHLEAALSFVADHGVNLVCAGRTDTGVHAIQQVAHFDSDAIRSERSWLLGANTRLPRDIRLKWVREVPSEFSARFSALKRSYRYIILNSSVPSAIFQQLSSWEYRPLDCQSMHDCAQQLIGEHDFSAFRAAGCQSRSSMRNMHSIEVSRQGEMVFIDLEANAFLYHMVRNIVGSLVAVGCAEQDEKWFTRVFASGDRRLAAVTAPAAGLYFVRAFYAPQYKLPTETKKPVLF